MLEGSTFTFVPDAVMTLRCSLLAHRSLLGRWANDVLLAGADDHEVSGGDLLEQFKAADARLRELCAALPMPVARKASQRLRRADFT